MQTVDLVTRVASGDESAFDELYRRYVKLVRYIAFQLSHNSADTEEIVQEVFLQVHRSIQDLRDPKQVKGWISRITYSKSKMLFRKKRDLIMDDDTMNFFQNKKEEKRDYLPNENARYQMNLDALNECIGKLQYEYREVLTLFYFGQMSIKEIAELTQKPEGTVKSRMSYAKKNLKHIIELYERKNHMKITFFGASLHVLLMYYGTSLTASKLSVASMIRKKLVEAPIQCIAICAACVCVPVMAAGIVQAIPKQEESKLPVQNVRHPLAQVQTQSFQKVQYENRWVKTPYDAYKTLLDWAHCEVEMRQKKQEDIEMIKPVYQALSDYGEGYYRLLKQTGWQEQFNSLISEQ